MTKIFNTAGKSSIKLIRMNGAGNTFVIHDSRDNKIKINKNFINHLLDNKKIKKFDQFVEINKSENSDAKVTFWNIDGSEAEMCGNALRCISSLILNKKDIKVSYHELGVLRKKYLNPFGLINRLVINIKAIKFLSNYIKNCSIDLVYTNTSTILCGGIAAKKMVYVVYFIFMKSRKETGSMKFLVEK